MARQRAGAAQFVNASPKMVVTALTDRDKELLAMRPIASNFPVRFASGARFNSLGF